MKLKHLNISSSLACHASMFVIIADETFRSASRLPPLLKLLETYTVIMMLNPISKILMCLMESFQNLRMMFQKLGQGLFRLGAKLESIKNLFFIASPEPK
jgi:hypothetical protein